MIEYLKGFTAPLVLIVGLTGWFWRLHSQSSRNLSDIAELKNTVNKTKEELEQMKICLLGNSRSIDTFKKILSPSELKQQQEQETEYKVRVRTLETAVKEIKDILNKKC